MSITCRLSGRCGNNLFQIAATYAHAKRMNTDYFIPSETIWHESIPHNLPFDLPIKDIDIYEKYHEPNFHYDQIPERDNICLTGYFQSEKYWKGYESDIKKLYHIFGGCYQISPHLMNIVDNILTSHVVCITVRRGDYVGNPVFYQLPDSYYVNSYKKYFHGQEVVMFSDDIEYCKKHFKNIPNIFFVENATPLEQLILSFYCDDFIVSNSTFSWWMAYLGYYEHKTVIRPSKHFAGKLLKENTKDYYPENWITYEI